MSILDLFGGKKDPDVVAAEKRAFDEESARVKLSKKNAAIRAAAERGKQKARGGSGTEATAAKVGKGILSAGGKLMELGKYGASLNWGNEPVAPQRTQKTTGKKQKKQAASSKKKQQVNELDQFAMPEFPF